VPEDARVHHADGSGGGTVVNGKGLVVSRGSCLFVCYHVCIIVSPCAVRSARLQGPTVLNSPWFACPENCRLVLGLLLPGRDGLLGSLGLETWSRARHV
jgi:hypothetical protein